MSQYSGASYVPDSVIAYDWMDPMLEWVVEQEIAGNLDDILPVGFSIDVEGIGVLGHSRCV